MKDNSTNYFYSFKAREITGCGFITIEDNKSKEDLRDIITDLINGLETEHNSNGNCTITAFNPVN